jgi:hypothetical protein
MATLINVIKTQEIPKGEIGFTGAPQFDQTIEWLKQP